MRPELLSNYNVVAAYESPESARKAVTRLEGNGFDAVNIAVMGPRIEEEASQQDTRDRDTRMARHAAWMAIVWGGAGTVAGGIIGFVAGVIGFTLIDAGPSGDAGIWITSLSGAIALGVAAGIIGTYLSVRASESWELTFQQARGGEVLVAVRSEKEKDAERAAAILKKTQPLSIERFDAAGRSLGRV